MKKIFLLLILFLSTTLFSQENKPSWVKEHVVLGGYIKYMNTINFHDGDDLISDNLWHNRVNLKVYLSDTWQINTGLRNRIFYGDMLKIIPNYSSNLKNDGGIVNLTHVFIDDKNVVMQSTFDRLSLNYSYNKWQITLGRQRINWGKNTVWNPNDWFNTSNYLDFDYEEKPGIDAVRVSYNVGEMSNIEIAYTSDKDFGENQTVLALKYQFTYKSYDWQLLAGKYKENIGLGIGWEGSINNLGFKGETTFFKPDDETKKNFLLVSAGLDYSFKNGNNWLFSVLYNGNYDVDNPSAIFLLFSSRLDVQNLFPSDWALFNQFSGNFGPIWQWRLGGMYATQNNLFILKPSILCSIADNWEVDMNVQSFFADLPYIKQRNILFLRIRFSY